MHGHTLCLRGLRGKALETGLFTYAFQFLTPAQAADSPHTALPRLGGSIRSCPFQGSTKTAEPDRGDSFDHRMAAIATPREHSPRGLESHDRNATITIAASTASA